MLAPTANNPKIMKVVKKAITIVKNKPENSKLKKLVADLSLDIVMLKDVNSRRW